MDYLDLLDVLRQRSGGRAPYDLDRMRRLLEVLDHPERRFGSWLIAGTNGKGSVSAMLEAIARAAGRRTGLNTSPHLNRVTERIRLDGVELGPDEMIALFHEVEEVRRAHGLEVTFFETVTAMAFCCFASRQVEQAVVEVGLGGRLDATNLLPCQVSAVVSIDFDHTRILGSTLAEIATEKAHVARPGCPLVVGRLAAEAMDATLRHAEVVGARVLRVGDHISADAPARLRLGSSEVRLQTALAGPHQTDNAAVAALVALAAGLSPDAIERGLASVRWPGRLEEVDAWGRRYVLDAAHNVAGATALGHALRSRLSQPYELVVATSGSRDTGAFASALAAEIGWPSAVRACTPDGHRVTAAAEVAQRLRSAVPDGIEIRVVDSVEQALRQGEQQQPCLVTGSMYLVGEALAHLTGQARDPFVSGR